MVTRVYTYGNDLISQDQLLSSSWIASFYGYDGHGNTRFLTDVTGEVSDTYDFDAFGVLVAQTGSTPNLYLYSGEQQDPHLGLQYLRARYLNQNSGRFWSRDKWGGAKEEPFSLHQYNYVNAGPVNGIDPTGLMSLSEAMVVMREQVSLRTPQGPSAQKAFEATRKALCTSGRLAFTAAALYGGHHTYPKFLGGPAVQKLAKLSPEMHRILHTLLHMFVKEDSLLGELSALGGKSGSTDAWAEALNDPEKAKRALKLLKKATAVVDKFCKFNKPTLTDELNLMLR